MVIDYEKMLEKLFDKYPSLSDKEEKMFNKLSEWCCYELQLADKMCENSNVSEINRDNQR